MKRLEQFWDRVPTSREVASMRNNLGRDPLHVRSLQEVADIINASGRYETKLSASDVLRIEKKALAKLGKVLRHD